MKPVIDMKELHGKWGPVFAPPRIGGFSPIATDMTPPRCHAGAAHGPARDRGAAGVLCDPCATALDHLLEAA